MRCLFLSHHNDLHAAVVSKLLCDYAGVQVDTVAVDEIAGGHGTTFLATPSLSTVAEAGLHASDYDLIWARRLRMPQRKGDDASVEASAYANSESQAAIEGICLSASERQIVVNPLLAERRAESKLWQLHVAPALGFAIPETMCSNNPADIRRAIDAMGGKAVVKKLRGTHHRNLLTLDATPEMMDDDLALAAAPLLVQQRIDAECHYRVHIFLSDVMAFRIESDSLDWRPGAGRGAVRIELPSRLVRRCLDFREASGLYYCILDLVHARDGTVYFLECNPQGQFLFIEQRTGAPVSIAFAAMLLSLLSLHDRVASLPRELPA